jgi:hypothetical protein
MHSIILQARTILTSVLLSLQTDNVVDTGPQSDVSQYPGDMISPDGPSRRTKAAKSLDRNAFKGQPGPNQLTSVNKIEDGSEKRVQCPKLLPPRR